MRIRAFRGYRYAGGDRRDLSAVVAPPYDQIGPDTGERLRALSPHNIARITLPRAEDGADPYRSARRVLEAWLAAGVWAADPEPALYPYAQTFAADGGPVTRTGFIALGEVTEYARGVVRPHERTHAGPKQDRLHLLEATGADTGLLFMLVSDPDGALREAAAPDGAPVGEARDLHGELHRLWRITDPARIARVEALMAPRPVIIADGHHRYETAVEYARVHPEGGWKLMAFFALEAPGLAIRPNHRLLRGLADFSLPRLAEAAQPWFETAPLPDPLAFRPDPRTLGVIGGAEARAFRLRDGALDRLPWPPGTSRAWRGLAVSILHEGLLKPLLGVTDAVLEARSHVDYVADQAEAIRLVRAGRYQAACLVAPTTTAELQAVVASGERLPPKSTHFYPKLLDGLVFHRLVDR